MDAAKNARLIAEAIKKRINRVALLEYSSFLLLCIHNCINLMITLVKSMKKKSENRISNQLI